MNDQTQDTLFSSASSEHYTPSLILDAAIATMGGIDLDPCSNPEPYNVPAFVHYTRWSTGVGWEGYGGLQGPWFGRVFMNPPYGRLVSDWIDKLRAEFALGRATEAITLLPGRTDTKWFQLLRDYPVCLVRGRLKFGTPEGEGAAGAPFPSAVHYLGPNLAGFVRAFSPIGDVYVRVKHEVLLASAAQGGK